MRIHLEIISGPSAGKKITVAPGQFVQVGRTSRAELSLPSDRTMAGLHFGVEASEDACVLKALSRTEQTLVNGVKVREAPLRNGDQIVAGGNTFTVIIESEIAAPSPPPPPP